MTEASTYRDDYDTALTEWRQTCAHPEDIAAAVGPVRGNCPACDTYLAACEAFTEAVRAANETDACDGFDRIGREALCIVCGQSFNLNDPADLIHVVTTVPAGEKWGPDYTGDLPEGPERYCGGRGELTGAWG